MARTLHIELDEPEFCALASRAQEQELTPEELLRQMARGQEGTVHRRSAEEKRAALEAAAQHNFPTADIDRMLAEIEEGYRPTVLK